jgi:hypothetical protein
MDQEPLIKTQEEIDLEKELEEIRANKKRAQEEKREAIEALRAAGGSSLNETVDTITPEMEKRLVELGFLRSQINKFTPEDAVRIIKKHEGEPAKIIEPKKPKKNAGQVRDAFISGVKKNAPRVLTNLALGGPALVIKGELKNAGKKLKGKQKKKQKENLPKKNKLKKNSRNFLQKKEKK